MSAFDRQRQIELNIGKTFINAIGVDSVKFGNEAHFMSFTAIITSRNGTRTRIIIPETL
jgi:hypothetical protein